MGLELLEICRPEAILMQLGVVRNSPREFPSHLHVNTLDATLTCGILE